MQFTSVFPMLIHILLAECRMTSEHWFCHHLQSCVVEPCMFGIVFHICSSQFNIKVSYSSLWTFVDILLVWMLNQHFSHLCEHFSSLGKMFSFCKFKTFNFTYFFPHKQYIEISLQLLKNIWNLLMCFTDIESKL